MPGRHLDLLLYVAHLAFWAAFALTRLLTRAPVEASPASGPRAPRDDTARFSRAAVGLHVVSFTVLYSGVGYAVLPGRVPSWFAGQRVIGLLVIALGAGLVCWAIGSFRSFRIRARLEPGHQLVTHGAFGLVRHPIYMGLDLLALGTAIWVPTALVWAGLVLTAVGGDLRARSEETLLARAFGAPYLEYCARTRRFVPGVY